MLRRAAVAVACASTMALGGLPTAMQAVAKPKPLDPGIPCFEYFDLLEDAAGLIDLPEGDASRAKSQWDTYEYVNEAKKWDGLQAPSPADEARLKDLPTKPPKSKPVDRIYWTWIQAKKKNPKAWSDWDHWRDVRFIRNSGNDPRGKAFEKKVIKDHGLTSKDWICQKEVIFEDPETGTKHRRQLDAYNPKTGKILEIKGNGEVTDKQILKDRAWAKDPKWRGTSWKYVFAEPQKEGTRKFIDEQRRAAQAGGRGVTEYNYRSDKVEKAPGGGVRYKSTTMQPPGKPGIAGGGASDLIRESRPNPKSMKEFLDRKNAADPKRLSPRGPGGVDFTTLELRYVGKPQKGKGLDYGFSAEQDPTGQSGWGGKAKSRLISDAFFTWLALTPEKFWVNLNPDQPEKIMDAQFGKTDAGRVLLESDLELKKDFASAMNPTKRPEADQYWKSLPRNDKGQPCWFQVRNWIEPKEAVVREENGGIHILDTPLAVKAEHLKIDNVPGDPYLCDFDEAEKKATERRLNRLIMPEVEKQVNTSPRYADLRRVYTARVAAEFVRQQDAKKPTDYHKIINSNDVSAWPLRAPNQDWKREQTYQAYLDSLKKGEESWEHDAGGGPYTYSVGGVDFSKQPKRNMNKVRFTAEHRHLPKQTRTSVQTLTDNTKDGERNLLLLGGNTATTDTGGGGGGSEPDPTPTPTPTDEPTGGPTSPAPDPSGPDNDGDDSSPGSGGDKPTAPAEDPGGNLAGTGAGMPVGLIAAIAAALSAAGAALMWWKRSRSQEGAQ